MQYVRAFGRFWYDFLIGDRPELFVGSIVVLVVVWVAITVGLDPTIAGGLLAVLVITLGGLSVWGATRRSS